MAEPLKPTALIDFPKLEPGHVWLMSVLVSLSREPLTAQSLVEAEAVVAEYKKRYGF